MQGDGLGAEGVGRSTGAGGGIRAEFIKQAMPVGSLQRLMRSPRIIARNERLYRSLRHNYAPREVLSNQVCVYFYGAEHASRDILAWFATSKSL